MFDRLIKKGLFKDFLTPRRLRRVLWYGVYMLVVLIVQDMVLTQIRPGGVCAFIPPAAVAAVAMFEGAIPGVVFALVMGIFTDMFTPGTLITYTLLFPFIAFCVGILAQFFVNRRFLGFAGGARAHGADADDDHRPQERRLVFRDLDGDPADAVVAAPVRACVFPSCPMDRISSSDTKLKLLERIIL